MTIDRLSNALIERAAKTFTPMIRPQGAEPDRFRASQKRPWAFADLRLCSIYAFMFAHSGVDDALTR